jgi:predicted transcriptional regulator
MILPKPRVIPEELKYKNEIATKVDSYTLEALFVVAQKENMTRSSLVRQAIYEFLINREKQVC